MPRKLSMLDAQMIRRRKLAGDSVTQLCLDYNCTPSTIYGIVRGTTYREGDGTTGQLVLPTKELSGGKVLSGACAQDSPEDIQATLEALRPSWVKK